MNAAAQSERHRTVTLTIPASRDAVFGFLADPRNLPVWATEFCEQLKFEDGHYKVVTSMGELFFRVDADAARGVIDMYSGPALDQEMIFPCRVLDVPGLGAVVSFTFFRTPDMPDDLYERQYASLLKEMDGLVQRFASQ